MAVRTPVLLFAGCILTAVLAGCGNSNGQATAAGDAARLCAAIGNTGLARQCRRDIPGSAINVVTDTEDDQAARNICTDIANRIRPLTSGLAGNWELQIFSPYRGDKPLAHCPLH
jgi:hypothetical protein